MKRRKWLFTAAALSLGILTPGAAKEAQSSAPDRLTVNIDLRQTAAPISKYLYGGFIEHIGSLIYRSLWSEMIDDRKFYFPISSTNTDQSNARPGRPWRRSLRKWRPIGPDEAVLMDKEQPFVGDHSPRIQLEGAAPRGIRQSGLTLVKVSSTQAESICAALQEAK